MDQYLPGLIPGNGEGRDSAFKPGVDITRRTSLWFGCLDHSGDALDVPVVDPSALPHFTGVQAR